MTTQDLPFDAAPTGDGRVRDLTIAALRLLSRALDTLARRMSVPTTPRPRVADPLIEFYGDAGAPEGALYVDGKLVGHVLGVNRL